MGEPRARSGASGRVALSRPAGGLERHADRRRRERNATIATTSDKQGGHGGRIAFEDATHLLVLEYPKGGALWRWDLATNHWDRVFTVDKGSAVGHCAAGDLVGYADGQVVIVRDGHVVRSYHLGALIDGFAPTRDGSRAAVQIETGVTALLDCTSLELGRRLEAGDENGAAPMFDDRGELLLRTARGTTTIWDPTTGDALVSNLDLLRTQTGVSWGSTARASSCKAITPA